MVTVCLADGHRFQVDMPIEKVVEALQTAQREGRLAQFRRANGEVEAFNPAHVVRTN